MKKILRATLAVLLVLCMSLSIISCDFSDGTKDEASNEEYAYLSIDINPSIELVIKDGIVESVKACNDDAEILLTDETIEGLSVEEASKKIVELAEAMGYLNDTNQEVEISIAADDEETIVRVEAEAKSGTEKGSKIAKFKKSDRAEEALEVKELKEIDEEYYKDLNPAKLRLIKALMEYDETVTIEAATQMSIKELISLLDGYIKEYKDLVHKDIRREYKESCDALRKEAQKEIAKIYGEEYSNALEKHDQLKEIYDELKKNSENFEIIEGELSEMLGDEINLEKIEELIKENEDKMHQIKEGLELSDEDLEAINQINEEMNAYKEEIKTEMQEEIDAVKKEYRQKKHEKMNR